MDLAEVADGAEVGNVLADDDAAGDVDVAPPHDLPRGPRAGGVAVQDAERPSSEDGMAASHDAPARSGRRGARGRVWRRCRGGSRRGRPRGASRAVRAGRGRSGRWTNRDTSWSCHPRSLPGTMGGRASALFESHEAKAILGQTPRRSGRGGTAAHLRCIVTVLCTKCGNSQAIRIFALQRSILTAKRKTVKWQARKIGIRLTGRKEG